ncbi:alkaline phosphatase family protein [Streptomyces morookaense]|uniref:alkaline phosphatase family protein n=1 Tax=Streptomyces morookaense TaxID=1970 RepID=UPI0033D53CE3
MTGISRRRLLTGAAAAALGGTTFSALPGSVQRAVAAGPARSGSLKEVRHVVLLMQENRSFDHYFGTLKGVRGFDDPHALRLSNGRNVFHQPDSAHPEGYLLPFRLDTHKTSAQSIPSTSHAWDVQHEAWNGGRMDRWMPAHRHADGADAPYVMGYHTREDIPFQFALAEAFTVCDNYFCSVLGPTWPNRLHWMSGTIDPGGTRGGPVITNDYPPTFYRWTTYAERLQDAGFSWQVYQGRDNGSYNVLNGFKQFREARPGDPLYERGMRRLPEDAFEDDVRNDRLPAVSWLIPSTAESEHPDSLPAAGADYVARKLEAIAGNPDVWNKTVFILNYDENDGLFDHVPPPVPLEGTKDEFVSGRPIGGGFRVPCLIISPWTVGGWVAQEAFDHTSCLRFLESWTAAHGREVREPNISAWRRRTFGDLTSAFGFAAPARKPPRLPADTREQLAEARQEVATLPKPAFPTTGQTPPRQERGSRRHR